MVGVRRRSGITANLPTSSFDGVSIALGLSRLPTLGVGEAQLDARLSKAQRLRRPIMIRRSASVLR